MSAPADAPNKGKQSHPRNPVGALLSLPPRWLGLYEDFIAKNASQVSQLESALRSLTYVIPGMPWPPFAPADITMKIAALTLNV